MAGNHFGKLFTLTTFGESHGSALGGIVDGCPPGLPLCETDIQHELDRRKPGQSQYTTQRKEADQVKLLSGIFDGRTTGTPIGLIIENTDHKSKDYKEIANKFRPGHADMTYWYKYGTRDYRGGGRASARETTIRVAAGAIAKKYLHQHLGIQIYGYLAQMGSIQLNPVALAQVEDNAFFCPEPEKLNELKNLINQLRKEGDSIGAKLSVRADNVPIGLGEPVFEKLDAEIARAMMSINAVKAVSLGDGFDVVSQRGSQHRDQMDRNGFRSNHAGGTLGGISSGQSIKVDVAFKPTSSIVQTGNTLDLEGQETTIQTKGRHDPCVGVRGLPIAEAMLALTLMDHFLRHRGQNCDIMARTTSHNK